MPELDDYVRKLGDLAQGLLYPSESDEPFEVVRARTPGNWMNGQQADVEEFFASLVEDNPDAERFTTLEAHLRKLSHLQVWRVGQVRVEIYVIGERAGEYVGLRTVSVET